jgi:hypothetical protein
MKILKRLIFLSCYSLIFLAFIYSVFFFNYEKFIKIEKKFQDNPLIIKIYNLGFRSLSIIENQLDFSRVFYKLKEQEPDNLNINMSAEDYANLMSQIEFFKKKTFIKDEYNYWRKAKLFDKKEKYNIEYKLHGTSVTPLHRGFFNLRIKFNKKEKFLNNQRQFNLIKLYQQSDEKISTIIINNIANDIGLLSPRGELILVKINNVNLGLFYKQERHSKEWFEKQKITNYSLLKNNDDWDKKYHGHFSDLDLHEQNIEISGESNNSPLALGSLKILFKAIRSNDLETIFKLIDVDYFAKFIALLSVFNNPHMISGDNLKFVYDHSQGSFKVLFRIESDISTINTDLGDFNKSLFFEDNILTQELFKILIEDSDFRNQRDKYLQKIINKRLEIIEEANKFYEEGYKYIMFSNLAVSHQNHLKKMFFKTFDHNLQKITEYLSYAKIYVSQEKKDGSIQLSIINDSYVPIKLKSIKLKNKDQFNENYLLPSIKLNENLNYYDNKIFLISSNHEINQIEFENSITKKKINNDHIYINRILNYKISDKDSMLSSLKFNNINFILNEKKLRIKKGKYTVNKNIITPIGINVEIEKGAEFFLSKNISILFQGNLSAEGTNEENISIKAKKRDEPFGTFAVLGQNLNYKTKLSYFFIEGGSEAVLEGKVFLGQLSIHNSDVTIDNSKISKSFSDDGANIRNSSINITNTTFSNNRFDQLDLDFCNGVLKNNEFVNQVNDSKKFNGGDGIDLSGSNVLIEKNQINNLSDKGVSVGEKSNAIIQGNMFLDNNIAIAIKDESIVYNYGNQFTNNDLKISMYIKKFFFKEPILYLDKEKKYLNVLNNKYEIIKGKIIFIDETLKSNFFNKITNEITSSRI